MVATRSHSSSETNASATVGKRYALNNWSVREDIRDLTQIQQINQLELLVELLATRSAHHR
jgi:hypothetical protein